MPTQTPAVRLRTLGELFWELFKISLLVIGGGYSILAVAEAVFARKRWIAEGELLEHLPVFQMVPGLIATHTAVYVGRKRAGALGAVVGVLAVALPSVVVFLLVSTHYQAIPLEHPLLKAAFVGLRASLSGIIAATVIRAFRRFIRDGFSFALLAVSLAALASGGVSVAVVLLLAMLAGLLTAAFPAAGERRHWSLGQLLLLLPFLKYGALCLGGGFVLVPMYVEDFVGPAAAALNLPAEEFSNLMALTQMTPGPIGVNAATFFGYRLLGFGGALAASFLLLLPGSLMAYFVFGALEKFRTSRWVLGFQRGVRPASVALMLSALGVFVGIDLSLKSLVLTALVTLAAYRRWASPVVIILVSAAISLLISPGCDFLR